MGKYRYFGNSKRAYELKLCAYCNDEVFMPKEQIYCSISCARFVENNMYKGGLTFKGTIEEYKAFHYLVKKTRGKAVSCVNRCKSSRYHWANLSEHYEDANDYINMCPSCHHRFDKYRVAVLWGE
jgi:hypothetical protein